MLILIIMIVPLELGQPLRARGAGQSKSLGNITGYG